MSRCGCLVLVCGIPGSGKTTLAQELSGHYSPPYGGSPVFLIPLHTDFLYPLDLRVIQIQDVDQFNLREARREFNDCLRHLLHVNSIGLHSNPPDCFQPMSPHKWDKLVQWLTDHKFADSAGKFSFSGNVAVVIDDNLHLRSMRYEYYQMARDYGLGFVEIFLQCPLATALTRNAQRSLPLPPSTVKRLEETVEPPDPEGHRWEEGRSVVLSTDCCWTAFIPIARDKVFSMITESFSKPVQPLSCEDMEMKLLCRLDSLHSHTHQADVILRKCVSEAMNKQAGGDRLERASLARRANSVRRDILEQLKNGKVESCWNFEANSREFKTNIEELFLSQLYDTK